MSLKYVGDIFSLEFIVKLSKYIGIKNYQIDLIDGPQSSYSSIYSLVPVKLETLKTYIEINLANNFI